MPGVDQPALVVVDAEQQRPHAAGAPALARPPPADDDRLGAEVLDLDPLRTAHAGPVRRVQPLGDDALQPGLQAGRGDALPSACEPRGRSPAVPPRRPRRSSPLRRRTRAWPPGGPRWGRARPPAPAVPRTAGPAGPR